MWYSARSIGWDIELLFVGVYEIFASVHMGLRFILLPVFSSGRRSRFFARCGGSKILLSLISQFSSDTSLAKDMVRLAKQFLR